MSTQLPLAKWLNKELSELLECEVGEEYSKNILTIETEPEVKEFIGSLLDLTIARNKKFLDELLVKLKKPSSVPDVTVYVKPQLEAANTSKTSKSSKNEAKKEEQDTSAISKYKENVAQKSTFSLQPRTQGVKKSADRHVCECQASRHKLVGNCLNCGRIVCEQEGSGPCYFCGNLVCRREELEKINSGSNKGEQLKSELMSRTWKGFDIIAQDLSQNLANVRVTSDAIANDEKLKKAVEHKNKLIDFDRSSAKRTQVIDDESDYFNTNSKWMNQKQRALLEKKEEELNDKRFNRLNNKSYTFDFAGRKVVDDKIVESAKNYQKEIEAILKDNEDRPSEEQGRDDLINKDLGDITLTYIQEKRGKNQGKKTTNEESTENKKRIIYRLQDQELQEMKDDGMCLSMHQPWASLLVAGIKKHEGRGWYTPYRGRLWIQAASKPPDSADISEVENFYRAYYPDKLLKFPTNYPTSCLLGYVDLVDCLSSDAYREKFPNGESQSEFVFICSNARELVVKIPMSGQHKIFKLEKSVHQTAKKTSVMFDEESYNK